MKPESELWNDLARYDSVSFVDNNRLTKDEYGCLLAHAASLRSEDPHTKVGCCIQDINGRVLSTAYNGLISKIPFPSILEHEDYRVIKRKLVIHAEINALSFVNKGEAYTAYITINPCAPCAASLAANGIKQVVYIKDYVAAQEYKNIFSFYGISYRKLDQHEILKINHVLREGL